MPPERSAALPKGVRRFSGKKRLTPLGCQKAEVTDWKICRLSVTNAILAKIMTKPWSKGRFESARKGK